MNFSTTFIMLNRNELYSSHQPGYKEQLVFSKVIYISIFISIAVLMATLKS